jgi:phage N-6-adenine-methyltransferase
MGKGHAWEVIHSSADDTWRTPPELYDRLDREFSFSLDAAALEGSKLAPLWYGPNHTDETRRDALNVSWEGATTFLNPPYGRTVGDWIRKAHKESRRGSTVVVLVMACTETRWFREIAWKADELRFIQGRVKFLRGDGTPAAASPKGSVLIVFRPNVPPDGWAGGPRCSLFM